MLNNMKLSTKLIGGFGIIFFFLLSITAVMFNALNKTTGAFEVFMEEDFGIASNALKLETLLCKDEARVEFRLSCDWRGGDGFLAAVWPTPT